MNGPLHVFAYTCPSTIYGVISQLNEDNPFLLSRGTWVHLKRRSKAAHEAGVASFDEHRSSPFSCAKHTHQLYNGAEKGVHQRVD
jgi:hypothetical protein